MRIRVVFLFSFMITVAANGLYAQFMAAERFNRAFSLHMDRMIDLYNFRGMREHYDCYGESYKWSQFKAHEAIQHFLSRWKSAPRPAVLIFYHHDADTLHRWLFTSNTACYASTPVNRDSLIAYESGFRRSLGVGITEIAGRGTRRSGRKKRGQTISLTAGAANTLEHFTEKWSGLLFPEQFHGQMTGKGHLFVIPELNIGQLPFWTLRPFGTSSMLVDSMSYSIVPNVCGFLEWKTVNMGLDRRQAMTFSRPLIVGNPAFHKKSGLADLPGAEKEAEEVADMLGSTALTGKNASLKKVKDSVYQADLIYLATHAYSSPDHILDSSWIALSPGSGDGDGKWYLREIQHSSNYAKLAVLSACQTGYGKVLEGGVVGLGRAFMKAGTRFTVMSLWAVSDRSTSYLMQSFMKELARPNYYAPAEPLRRAILKTREMYPGPEYWAPFILFGFTY